jgi:hypothetical protein
MQLRTILLSSFQEFDNGVTHSIPIDFFKGKLIERNVTPEDFDHELMAALHEGDFSITSPGMIEMTDAGAQHYARNLQLI